MYESMAVIALKSCTGVVIPGPDVSRELGAGVDVEPTMSGMLESSS